MKHSKVWTLVWTILFYALSMFYCGTGLYLAISHNQWLLLIFFAIMSLTNLMIAIKYTIVYRHKDYIDTIALNMIFHEQIEARYEELKQKYNL